MSKPITNSEDTIDVRGIIGRFEELETLPSDLDRPLTEQESNELHLITELLAELKGDGGDEEWRGDWYPITLIRESYFVHYAQELAEDCGDLEANAYWPYTCIDWNRAAIELSYDYSGCFIDSVFYYYR